MCPVLCILPSFLSAPGSRSAVASSVHPDDIGNYVCAQQLPFEDRRRLLKDPWTPSPSYRFPVVPDASGKNRKFQRDHIAEFPWLTYSAVPGLEGGFCPYCVLMGRQVSGWASGDQALRTIVTEPFKRFKDAKRDLRHHQTTQYHADVVTMAEEVLMGRIGIDELVDGQRREERNRNSKRQTTRKDSCRWCRLCFSAALKSWHCEAIVTTVRWTLTLFRREEKETSKFF